MKTLRITALLFLLCLTGMTYAQQFNFEWQEVQRPYIVRLPASTYDDTPPGTLGLGVEAIIDYWKAANHCEGEPAIDSLPVPNPSSGIVEIRLETAGMVTVVNVQGQQVYRRQLPSGTTQLDLSACPPGLYFVKGPQGITAKLVRQ